MTAWQGVCSILAYPFSCLLSSLSCDYPGFDAARNGTLEATFGLLSIFHKMRPLENTDVIDRNRRSRSWRGQEVK